MTEHEIIQGCKKGQERAFRELVNQYAPMLMGVCKRYMKHTQPAEDVLQETFIRIFEHISQYRSEGAFGGWLRRIAVTTSLKALRKQEISTDDLDNGTEVQFESDFDAIAEFETEEIIALINTLPENYRQVFNLFVVEGYAHNEISELLEINESTSRARLARARALLKAAFVKKNLSYEVATTRRVYSK